MMTIDVRPSIRQKNTDPFSYIIYANEATTRHELGGKAGALAELEVANMPIPAWFVVSPAAFTVSLSLTQRATLEAICNRYESAAVDALLATVQLTEQVRDQLEHALAKLCPHGEMVAVRSSALDEDGGQHSFAGQFETFLFVRPEQVAARIIDVWRSGLSERVLTYRREHGLEQENWMPPAVLVQRMVNADVSGVAFSADPVSGKRSLAVVSALYGLGTALVSGECDADTCMVDRNGAIALRSIARKKSAHHYLPTTDRVQSVRVTSEQASKPALTDTQVRAVAELARSCERQFGCPQDIEWAIADDRLYLLQSRPVTALAQMRDPDGEYALWDNSNIAESYNGVTTPLTFSFARYAYEQVYRQLCRVLGIPDAMIRQQSETFRHMIGLIDGRIYYNLLNWYRLLALMPGFTANRTFMEQMMGVKEGLPEQIVAELGKANWQERLHDNLRFVATIGALLANYRRLPRDIWRFSQRIDEALEQHGLELGVELEQMRADELVDAYRSLERQLITRWDTPLVNDLFTMMCYGTLRKLVVSWCGDETGSLQNDLLTGEGGIISAEPALRVREMAGIVAPYPELVELLCTGSRAQIMRAIEKLPPLVTAYQAYLEQFADRCLEELKLESATLRDDPLPLLRSIGHMARRLQTQPDSQNKQREATSVATPRAQAEQRVAEQLRGHPLRRLVFGWMLKQTRERVRDRENLRFERTRVFGRVRRIFSELGRRFYALDLLEEPRDIFYLEVEEALGFVTGTATTTNLKGLTALRKAEFERFNALTPAQAPSNRFETRGIVNQGNTFREQTRRQSAPLNPQGVSGTQEMDQHKGIGCCPGIVRGPVRVVTNPKTAELHSGEILVARRTDPGWILLFPAAAGVLVEHGSLLSHSAIVAREMGIPTIVGLSDVTSWLHDGDWVELDGSCGIVRKIER